MTAKAFGAGQEFVGWYTDKSCWFGVQFEQPMIRRGEGLMLQRMR